MREWLRGGSKGHALRASLVAVVATFSLAITLPDLYQSVYHVYGSFGFSVTGGVVDGVDPRAKAAGVRVGDRVDFRAMPIDDRYGVNAEWFIPREPPIGKTVTFRLIRGDGTHLATLTAAPEDQVGDLKTAFDIYLLGALLVTVVATIFAVAVGSALFLIRPTPLTLYLFLFAIGIATTGPTYFSYLPAAMFAALDFVCAVLAVLGGLGFLMLALQLGLEETVSRKRLLRVLLALVAVVSLPIAAAETHTVMGLPSSWLYLVYITGFGAFYVAALPALFSWALNKRATRGERRAAVWLLAAGSLEVIGMIGGWLPPLSGLAQQVLWFINRTALLANVVPVPIVAYIILHERVVHAGLVTSRILSYTGFMLAALIALVLFNWELAPQLGKHPIVIPLEILIAVAIGYWFSGLRDVASALSLAESHAQTAAAEGRSADEHDALTQALGLAERTRQKDVIAEVRARFAFSAWLDGNDAAFESHVRALRQTLGQRSLRGLAAFARAADPMEDYTRLDPMSLPEWKARTLLVASARTDDASLARERARDAFLAAEESGLPFLRILTHVALAEMSPSERDALVGHAEQLARGSGWTTLSKSLQALRSHAHEIGMLQPFVDVRLLRVRPARPGLEVAFFTGEVHALGTRVELPDKEFELLLSIASTQSGINADKLIDELWPEADGDAARNAFYVCSHRLRKHIGGPQMLRRVGRGYALHPCAEVDLWRFQAALDAYTRESEPERLEELRRLSAAFYSGSSQRALLGPWFFPFEQMLLRRVRELEQFVAA